MPANGGSYGSKSVGDGVASELKRSAAKRVSYDNTRRQVRASGATGSYGKFAHIKPVSSKAR